MAAYYSSIKSMRTAKVGTILPWGGDGNEGFLSSNLPKGWIVCDGTTHPAQDYPLLASVIGDTYGGNMLDGQGNMEEFPYEDTTADFRLPNLSSSVVMDLEESHLAQPQYQFGQGNPSQYLKDDDGRDLVKGYGETNLIKSTWEATADIDFTINLSGQNMYFKFTDITLGLPDFTETVYTLPRKLGINHTPPHKHSETPVPSTNIRNKGSMTFRTDQGVRTTGAVSGTHCTSYTGTGIECENATNNPTQWENGAWKVTYYGTDQYEHTLPRMENFWDFSNDSTGKNYWSHVPAGADQWNDTANGNAGTDATRKSGHANPNYNQNIVGIERTAQITNTEPVDTHKTPCYTGLFPRPMLQRNRSNFYGYTDTTGGNQPPVLGNIFDHPEAGSNATGFEVTGVTITNASYTITLPAGVDITREYGATGATWKQWDKITPLMYVTPGGNNHNDNKHKWLAEGSMVTGVTYDSVTDKYTVKLDRMTSGAATNVTLRFRHGTWPTSLSYNDSSKNPLEDSFRPHTHDSFEIAQTGGSITDGTKVMTAYTASDGNANALQAESLENALNIVCDTAQPNCTITFIIKAY